LRHSVFRVCSANADIACIVPYKPYNADNYTPYATIVSPTVWIIASVNLTQMVPKAAI